MKRSLIFFAMAFLVLTGIAFCGSEDMEIQVFEMKHRDAASMSPVVEHLKSDEGKVNIDIRTDSLIVVDHPSNLKRMAEIISRLDVPQKQVEIRVMVTEVTGTVLNQIGMISGQAVIPPEKFDEITYLIDRSEDSRVRSEMTVRTMSGRPAAVQVAQEEIFPQTEVLYETGTTVRSYETRSAGKFLEVLPKVNNDGTIIVTLRPSVSEFQEDRSIDERSVLTQVIVESGDTIVIGGIDTQERHTEQDRIPLIDVTVPTESSKETGRIVMFLTATVL